MTGAVGLFLLIALIGYGVLADRALETTLVLVLYWSIHVTEIPTASGSAGRAASAGERRRSRPSSSVLRGGCP
jgi:hypothetical protein